MQVLNFITDIFFQTLNNKFEFIMVGKTLLHCRIILLSISFNPGLHTCVLEPSILYRNAINFYVNRSVEVHSQPISTNEETISGFLKGGA